MPTYASKEGEVFRKGRRNIKEKLVAKEEFIPQIISLLSLKIFGP